MKLKTDTKYKLANGEIVGPLTFKDDVALCQNSLVGGKFIGQWTLDGEADMFCSEYAISKYADVFRIADEVAE
jgi:hypothetical protein